MKVTIWSGFNGRMTVASDGYKFEAMIAASIDCQVFLSVGWSSGNLAWTEDDKEKIPLKALQEVAEKTASSIEWGDLYDQLPNLFTLCKAVDDKYNELLLA